MILEQIVTQTRRSVARRKAERPLAELEQEVEEYPDTSDFYQALKGEGIKVIAEIKRASPSKGWLCPDLKVDSLACSYAKGGAAAISVLTEPEFFRGSFADLLQARQAVSLPLLCKDFILEPYQIYEARAHGADAVLLIAAILSRRQLASLIEVAGQLGMSALVEVHDEAEVDKALACQASLIGINNRNLADFSVDIGTTLRLRPLISPEIVVVSESGIKSRADMVSLKEAGVNAVLIGEALVTSPQPEAKLKEFMV